MNRRDVLKASGGALAALLGGVVVASAAPTAASDLEKVEAIEDFIAKRSHAADVDKYASSIASPIACRAHDAAEADAKSQGLSDDEAYRRAADAHEAAWIEAYEPYKARVEAAWNISDTARKRVRLLFGEERIF